VSKNKNIGKVASFLRELIAGVVLILAVLGGFGVTTLLGAIAPYLFVVSIAISAAYNIGAALFKAYHYLTEKDDALREKHKESLKNYAIESAIATIGTVALSFLMLTTIAHVAMTIVNACFNAFCFSLGVYKAIKIYRHQDQEPMLVLNNPDMLEDKPEREKQRSHSKSPVQMDKLFSNVKTVETNNDSKPLIAETVIKNDYRDRTSIFLNI
ncbi:MAG: hypothetical protein O7D30_11960, partial [Rickettsia endosymbiont of Ixodes persulcatus]|nr:hypothetical protein [Rickettsia endosymbiont of Ixodes persulcatus]